MTDQVIAEVAAGEGVIPLREVAHRLPAFRPGTRTTYSCVLRWSLKGVRVPGGQRVRLEAVRCGGRWLTTEAAIQRFLLAQQPTEERQPQAPPRSPGQRQRASQRAGAQLEKIGI